MRELGISFKKDVKHIVILILCITLSVIFTHISVEHFLYCGPMNLLFFILSFGSAFLGVRQMIEFNDCEEYEDE